MVSACSCINTLWGNTIYTSGQNIYSWFFRGADLKKAVRSNVFLEEIFLAFSGASVVKHQACIQDIPCTHLSCIAQYYCTHFTNEELGISDLPGVSRFLINIYLLISNFLLNEPLSCFSQNPSAFQNKILFLMFCLSLSHCNHKVLACHYKSLGFSLLLQSFLNPPKLFAASGPKIHCLVTRLLGSRFPEQFFICQKWRSLCSAVTRQNPCLSCYGVKLCQWHGLGVKLGPL